MIDQTEEELACPEDGVTCQFFNKEVGIGCFPLNFALHKMLRQKEKEKPEEPIEKKKSPPTTKKPVSGLFCDEHSKKCELICLTDYKIVCTDCIIFGIHKNHQYSKVEDFQKEVKIKASTLENKIETFKYRHFLNDNEEQIEVLREKVKGKKEKLKSRIKENVESLIEEIKQKQKGLEEKLEMKFNKFDKAIYVISESSAKLKEKESGIKDTLNSIKEQIKNNEYNYQFLLRKLFTDENIFNSFKEVIDGLNDLENQTNNLIDNELDKYYVDSDTGPAIKLIHDSIEIKLNTEDDVKLKKEKLRYDDDELDWDKSEPTPKKEDDELFCSPVQVKQKKSRKKIKDRNQYENLHESHINNNNPKHDFDLNLSKSTIPVNKSTSALNRPKVIKKNNSFFRKNSKPQFNVSKLNQFNSSYVNVDVQNVNSYSQNFTFLPNHFQSQEQSGSFQYNRNFNDIYSMNNNARQQGYNNQMPSFDESIIVSNNNAKTQKRSHNRNSTENEMVMMSSRKVNNESNREINFSRLGITDLALTKILNEIGRNSKAIILDLNNNSITEIGFEQLLQKVVNHPRLEKIFLSNNQINDTVFIKIEKYARKFKRINYFDLTHNSRFKNILRIKKHVKNMKKLGIQIDV